MCAESDHHQPPLKIYERITGPARDVSGAAKDLLVKFRVFLPDRPGSLAGFASVIAKSGGNISFFHYDRAIDSSRVVVEVQLAGKDSLDRLIAELGENQFSFDAGPSSPDEVQVTALENVLEVKVRLVNRPGSLAAFAGLLAAHSANVMYMLYDEDIDPESADIALVTKDAGEIDGLLRAVNDKGYYYRVVYRGAGEQEVAQVIGLKMAEKFFLRLKKLLPAGDIEELKGLVESSRDLHQDLVHFYTEAGNNLEAGDVFEKVLTFASRSRSRTGGKFKAIEMPLLTFPGNVTLYGFRMPTSENIYLFRHGDELTMIDAAHGIYYDDIKKLLQARSLDPARIKRIFVTHPDTDHAGASGYFHDEFGADVFMHPGSDDVITNRNRAWGVTGGLLNLNKYYTRLSSRFTECRFPSTVRHFSTQDLGRVGAFRIIDRFSIGPLLFEVLESRGGHTPGLVFYLNQEHGLLFTSDYLLNVPSLLPEEKEHLSIYRYLLTSPNRNSRIYKEETDALKDAILAIDRDLKKTGRSALIFPGHGSYYKAGELTLP